MDPSESPTIPFEKQSDPESNRTCGAACLAMVYRSLGRSIPQSEIWPQISTTNRRGSLASATHRMAMHALTQGFAALAVQTKHPLQALQVCQNKSIRAILNHRLKAEEGTGHFTVLVSISADSVVLHDPYRGPSRSVPPAELLELWQARVPNGEISGNVLIGIAAQPTSAQPCALCGVVIPPAVACPRCSKPVSLRPWELLGCVGTGCTNRIWNFIVCPACDHIWTFSIRPDRPSAADRGVDLAGALAAVDKLVAEMLTVPGVAERADFRRQIEFIEQSRQKLRLAEVEAAANRRTSEAQQAHLQDSSRQNEEAMRRRQEEIQKPAATPDGNSLSAELLKGLGIT